MRLRGRGMFGYNGCPVLWLLRNLPNPLLFFAAVRMGIALRTTSTVRILKFRGILIFAFGVLN